MRRKWTWDRVVRGSRGINCAGHCAFNVYVRNGLVWREEQQGEYGRSGEDTPDYGPRGCQKGVRHSKHMYGRQRVLYPMKRVGDRGAGRWRRVSWDQAIDEIADRFLAHARESGPDSITFATGTAMVMKRASFASLFRFANATGLVMPETFAGVGDLPVGAYMTLGNPLPGDPHGAVYKAKCLLVWAANPAVTRIPDAHFFWEARYNGTEVVTIAPDFNATAMHSSRWLNPRPGTDTALAMAMVQTILADGLIDRDYVVEQTDLPFLVREDDGRFLRTGDLGGGSPSVDPEAFCVWDEASGRVVRAPASGPRAMAGGPRSAQAEAVEGSEESLRLGAIRPALEGRWVVATPRGAVTVTTVFARLRTHCAARYTPEQAQAITGVHADNIRAVARSFARSGAGMIYAGFRSCKWLHGDKLHRAWLLMCALTGNTGREGGGLQTTLLPNPDGTAKFAFAGMGPRVKIAAISIWDYAHGDGRALNAAAYGESVAVEVDQHYRDAIARGWLPDYARTPWKMAFMAGHNPANWRAAGQRFRESVLAKVDTIVAMTPDMSVTAMYADYVLPVAHHYERQDFVMEGHTPFIQVLDRAVPPLGESEDDWQIMERLARAISAKARASSLPPVRSSVSGAPVEYDYAALHDVFTMNGSIRSSRDIAQFLIDNSFGMPKISFEELAVRGFVRGDDSEGAQFGMKSPYGNPTLASVRDKQPYPTLTGRQQFYFDHEWFLRAGEELPVHVDPLAIAGHPLRLTMGHARHGVHSIYREDELLLALQRGEPDIYVNAADATARGVRDGDRIRVFGPVGSFVAMAHLSGGVQPGSLFMFHGWDPMMFEGRRNFGAAIPTAGLLKPTSLVGGYGHLGYKGLEYVPNQTYNDHTVDFVRHGPARPGADRGRRDRRAVAMGRQVAMVIDLNKCVGCQTCTVACKSLWTDDAGQKDMLWNNVETKPGPGYPRHWEARGASSGWKNGALQYGPLHDPADYGNVAPLNHDDVYFKGTASRLQRREPLRSGANWDEDTSAGAYPNNYHFYLPRLCNHCTRPACLEACPVRAIYKREVDGIVLVDQDKCQGMRVCNTACPYDKVYFNHVTSKTQKCIFCFPRIEQGEAPACARQCPGRLRFVGFLDDPGGPIARLVEEWKVALPLHPEYGTGPNVFYVPPLLPDRFDGEGRFAGGSRIPREYLRSLFGAGVDAALETLAREMTRRRAGERSELMDLLIAKDWKSLFAIKDVRHVDGAAAARRDT